jgi:hypothetical protein
MTKEIYDLEAPFKYTVPIQKAFTGEDGKLRLTGAATGPETDLQGERIHPSLIDKWITQINSGEKIVPYIDWHKRDTSMAELGFVEKAWKDESGHMWVDIVLDDDNPVAQYIHKSISKGKQYGMSVYGKVTRFADEVIETGKRVRTFYDSTLDEISNTTRPVWVHSFGTVLSKAVDEMSRTADGDKSVANETETPGGNEEEVVTETTEIAVEKTTESGAATAPDTQATPEEAPAEAAPEVVEKAIAGETKRDEKRLAKLVAQYNALGETLRESGLLESEDAGAETKAEETVVQKSETDEEDRFVRLEKSIETLSATVLAIAENTPAGTAPGLLQKSENDSNPIDDLKAVEDPLERLRLAMAARYGEHGSLR